MKSTTSAAMNRGEGHDVPTARRQHQLEERQQRRRGKGKSSSTGETSQTAANFSSRIPSIPSSESRRRRRDSRQISAQEQEETPGDRLLSSLNSLEHDITTNGLNIDNDEEDSSTSSMSAIWRSATPFVASDHQQMKTPADPTTTQRSLTPTGPLLDKWDDLNHTWLDVPSLDDQPPVSSVKQSSKTRNSFRSNRSNQVDEEEHRVTNVIVRRTTLTPREGSLPTGRLSSGGKTVPHPRRVSERRRGDYSTSSIPSSRQRRRQPLQMVATSLDDQDGTSSVGASTISTISSTESVFDRLYRMGQESSERKQRLQQQQQQQQQQYSTGLSTPHDTPTRRLSYTPKMVTSPSRPKSIKSKHRSSIGNPATSARKNRLAAFSETQSVSSQQLSGRGGGRSHRSTTNIPRHVSSTQRSMTDDYRPGGGNDSDDDDLTVTSHASTHSQWARSSRTRTSVFDRLYRNERRSQPIWQAPEAFTPTKSGKRPTKFAAPSSSSSKAKRANTGIPYMSSATKLASSQRKPLSIDTSRPQSTKSTTSDTAFEATTATPPPTGSMDDALELLDDLLADSPRTATTVAATMTDDDNTTRRYPTRSGIVGGSATQHHQRSKTAEEATIITTTDDTTSTDKVLTELAGTAAAVDPACAAMDPVPETTLDDDLAEIEEWDKKWHLSSSGASKEPQDKLDNDSFDVAVEKVPAEQGGQALPHESIPDTTIDEDLVEIEATCNEWKAAQIDGASRELPSSSSSPQNVETTLDEDMAEIEQIGKDLRPDSGQETANAEAWWTQPHGARQQQKTTDGVRSLHSYGSCHSRKATQETTLDQDLQEIEQLGNEIRSLDGECSQHSSQRLLPNASSILPLTKEDPGEDKPAVIYLQTEENNNDLGFLDDMDVGDGIDTMNAVGTAVAGSETMTTVPSEWATAPTPRRRTTKPDGANQQEGQEEAMEDHNGEASYSGSLFREPRSCLFVETTTVPMAIPAAPTDSSRTSSGFFSLDERSGGLVMDDTCHRGQSLGSYQQQPPPQPAAPTSGRDRLDFTAAAISIQCSWRGYQAEQKFCMHLVESCHIEMSNAESSSAEKLQVWRLALVNLRNTNLDNVVEETDSGYIIYWEPHLGFVRTTLTVKVGVSIEACKRVIISWDRHKLVRRILRAILLENLLETPPADGSTFHYETPPGKAGDEGIRSSNAAALPPFSDQCRNDEDIGQSFASSSARGTPTLMDLTVVNQHRAAATIQNWFRLRVLDAALQQSTDSKGQLQVALEAISPPSNISRESSMSSSHESQMVNARRVLKESYYLESWLDPYDATGSLATPWSPTSGTPSQEWIERRAAAIAIHNIVQAYLRGLQRYRRHRKATVIQAAWRCSSVRKHYIRMCKAARVIQFRWCSHRFVQHQVDATTRLQALWRGTLARRKWELVKFSVALLQAAWRRFLEGRRLHAIQRIAQIMQTAYRSKPLRKQFLRARSAVVALQRSHRRRSHRKLFQLEWTSASLLQNAWRCSYASREYDKIIKAALLAQRSCRRWSREKEFHRYRKAAIAIQSSLRRHNVQRELRRTDFASVQIQCQWRRYEQLASYETTRRNAIFIQALLRRNKSRHDYVERRNLLIETIVRLQSYFRTFLVKRYIWQLSSRSIKMQAAVRGFQARKRYRLVLSVLVRIQAIARKIRDHRKVEDILHRLVLIQSFARGYLARSWILHVRAVIIMIQGNWRGYQQRTFVRMQRNSVIHIQRVARGYLLRIKKYREERAATEIQRVARGFPCQMIFKRRRCAAILIQSAWRASETRQWFSNLRSTSTMIQALYRGYRQRAKKQLEHNAAILLQALARAIFAKRINSRLRLDRQIRLSANAVVQIQTCYRSSRALANYEKARIACILIQSTIRMWLALETQKVERREHQNVSAICLQRHCRGHLVRSKRKCQTQAAKAVQSSWRGYIAERRFRRKLLAALFLQRAIRGCLARSRVLRILESVRSIQAIIRGHVVQHKICQRANAAQRLQSNWRACKARSFYLFIRSSASMIQAVYRGHRMKSRYRERLLATRVLQRLVKSFVSRKRVTAVLAAHYVQVSAARVIQNRWRTCFGVRSFEQKRRACTKLQSSSRRHLEVVSYRSKRRAIILVQAHIRSSNARERCAHLLASAMMMQATIRGFLARRNQQRTIYASIGIQQCWRAYICYHNFKKRVGLRRLYQQAKQTKAARKIQRSYRGFRSEKRALQERARQRESQELSSAVRIQTVVRGHFAKRRLFKCKCALISVQAEWRGSVAREFLVQSRAAAIIIQAMVRGCQVRRHFAFSSEATIQLQKVWRRHRWYHWYRNHLQRKCLYQVARQIKQARKIQALVRKWLITCRQRANSAMYLQACWRTAQVTRRYARIKLNILLIQSAVRRYINRRQYCCLREAAIISQAFFRMHIKNSAFRIMRCSVLEIQTAWRRFAAEEVLIKARVSAVMVQATMRGYFARKHVRASLSLTKHRHDIAATRIQQEWRRSKCHNDYRKRRASLMILQSWYRMVTVRSRYWFLRVPRAIRSDLDVAARKIQWAFLLWKMQLAVLDMQSSAVILKRCMRGQLARSAARFALTHMNSSLRSAPISPVARISSPTNEYTLSTMTAWNRAVGHAKVTAAIVIQAGARRMLIRLRLQSEMGFSFDLGIAERSMIFYQNEAATVIQEAYRVWMQRKGTAAVELQRVARCVLADKLYRDICEKKALETQRTAAVKIQGVIRALSVRLSIRAKRNAAIEVQRIARAMLAKNWRSSRYRAAILVQRFYRCYSCRKDLLRRQHAHRKIAVTWKVSRERRINTEKTKRLAAVAIQQYFRGFVAWQKFRQVQASILQIQKAVRQHFSAIRSLQATEAGDFLQHYVERIERAADETTNRYSEGTCSEIGGPCMVHFAANIRNIVAEAISSRDEPLPKYVEEIQKLMDQLKQQSSTRVPASRRSEFSPEKATTTPVRSNRAMFSSDRACEVPLVKPDRQQPAKSSAIRKPNADELAREARALLAQGRARIQTGQVSKSALVAPPALAENSSVPFNEVVEPTSPKIVRVTETKRPPSPPPGESFFEGDSKEIPSPIKQLDAEEWNWADEW